MATFDNLVAEAAGAPLIDRFVRAMQEGETWEFYLPVIGCMDDDGNVTDVDMTGVTAEAQILTKSHGGTEVATFVMDLVEGQWRGTIPAEDAAGLALNYSNPARYLPWFCTLTKGDLKVSAFGPHDSRITIKQGE